MHGVTAVAAALPGGQLLTIGRAWYSFPVVRVVQLVVGIPSQPEQRTSLALVFFVRYGDIVTGVRSSCTHAVLVLFSIWFTGSILTRHQRFA
nr:unnamed protein product [Callosobruchus analis]